MLEQDSYDTDRGYGGLAQLARAPALQAGGQRFESVILHVSGNFRIGDARSQSLKILHWEDLWHIDTSETVERTINNVHFCGNRSIGVGFNNRDFMEMTSIDKTAESMSYIHSVSSIRDDRWKRQESN